MDINKQPGIKITGIYLKQLDFNINPKFPEGKQAIPLTPEFGYGFGVVDNKLQCELKLNLFKTEQENYPFKLLVVLIGLFENDNDPNMTLDDFAKVNAPAIMFPYIREIIQDVTSKTSFPPIILPPINIVALIEANKKQG